MNCEIEFLPVGDGCKPGDAIVVRYGDVNSWELMVIDGGNLNSGKELVAHVKANFGSNAVISHAVVTHPDGDHASGMREVLEDLPVKNLWMHLPWQHAVAARPYFANKNWTDQGLAQELRREYDILSDLVAAALEKKIPIGSLSRAHRSVPSESSLPGRTCTPILSRSSTGPRMPIRRRSKRPAFGSAKRLGFWPACSIKPRQRFRNGPRNSGMTSA